mgnify:CR=1 FL=1
MFIGKAINKDYTTKELPLKFGTSECDQAAAGGTGSNAQIRTCVLLLKKESRCVILIQFTVMEHLFLREKYE